MNPQDHAYALPVGYRLEEYRIERVLGSGGFGITYLARDTHLDKAVAIKEYLPNEFAVRHADGTVGPKSSADAGNYRWGLERFLEEAQVLAGFDHPHINRVHRRLEAHGTAYLVLEYISGETLSARLRRTKVLPPEEAWRLFREMLSGLEVVHRQGYVHRDIKPGNIMLRGDGSSVLLDFGAARQLVGQRSKSVTSLLTPGYAPIEQYDSKAEDVGPWSDFYALGVTVYRCVTGVNEGALLEASVRMLCLTRGEAEKDLRPAEEMARGGYDRRLLRAIDECMKVDGRERPRDVAALRGVLAGVGPAPEPPHEGKDKDEGKGKGKPSPLVVWAMAGAVLLLVGLYPGVWQWLPSDAPAPAPVPAPPQVAEEPAGRAMGTVFRDALKIGGEGPQMVVLPTGSFRMGSPDTEEGRYDNEGPVRKVNISHRIAMGRYEVTFAEYDRFAEATSRTKPDDEGWGRGTRPVINVSQTDAKAYAAWLSEQTGKRYRLPSESEWEYAARAGTSTRYSWGDEINCGQARYGQGIECSDSLDGTVPVGSFEPNAFDLYDMHGNVWEWVEDCYHESYEGAPTDGRAWTTGCDEARAVVRGGSWLYYPRFLRSAYRNRNTPSDRIIVGFRLVQDLNP